MAGRADSPTAGCGGGGCLLMLLIGMVLMLLLYLGYL